MKINLETSICLLSFFAALNIHSPMSVKASEPGADISRPTAGVTFINPGVRAIGDGAGELNKNPHVGGTIRSGINGAVGGAITSGVTGVGVYTGAVGGGVGSVINHCMGCHNSPNSTYPK